MADRKQMDATYNYMDELFRATFGEHADITCALYDGDFRKTLEQAQRDKHTYILDALGVVEGSRLLDVGCGWGPLLAAARRRGADALGLTLSSRQAEACRRSGFEVWVIDWKDLSPGSLGRFDAVASVGAFEHFCSEEEYLAGLQGEIYERFFRFCADLLPRGGRLFLQTMTWGRNAPPPAAVSLDAPRNSDEYALAVLRKFYPGSFPPLGMEQIERCAKGTFALGAVLDGRLDYIRTMEEWGRVWRFDLSRLGALLRTVPYALCDPDLLWKVRSLWHGYNRQCFEREVLDHRRIVLEKRTAPPLADRPQ